MRRLRALAGAIAALLFLAGPAGAEPPKPRYLPYVEFAAEDSRESITLKRAYNDAVQRYNQALYEYHVVLDRHDRLVEAHNAATDPTERKKARAAAEALRGRLATLRRQVTSGAAAVDEAARRAVASGVTLPR